MARVAEAGALAQDPLERGVEPGRAGEGRRRAAAHGAHALAQLVVDLGGEPLHVRPRAGLRSGLHPARSVPDGDRRGVEERPGGRAPAPTPRDRKKRQRSRALRRSGAAGGGRGGRRRRFRGDGRVTPASRRPHEPGAHPLHPPARRPRPRRRAERAAGARSPRTPGSPPRPCCGCPRATPTSRTARRTPSSSSSPRACPASTPRCGSHEALLGVIARNCALSHLRSRRARARLGELSRRARRGGGRVRPPARRGGAATCAASSGGSARTTPRRSSRSTSWASASATRRGGRGGATRR